jgi:hypothetical protein
MKFCANFLKWFPIRDVAPTLLALLALAGVFGHGSPIFSALRGILGSYWG